MILFWRVGYFDPTVREFKDRDLWLDTDELDPVTKAAVEACNELRDAGGGRGMLKYRHLFRPENSSEEMQKRVNQSGRMASFCIPDYREDENGLELTGKRLAVALTGSETAMMLPACAKQHDIDYFLAEKPPIDINTISLSPNQLNILAYFGRDWREMGSSAFFKEGAGTLRRSGGSWTVLTAVNDEEIRSFVTIFRRLYMESEPANLAKAAAVFVTALASHAKGKWVAAATADIEAVLSRPPGFAPFLGQAKPTFTVKRLIDVFLYTQYAHQPNERRSRQFQQCLQDVGNDRALLTYLFLNELQFAAGRIANVGQQIAGLFNSYCQHHNAVCDVITSPGDTHPGIGALEKTQQREDRILREKAEELAIAMWHEAGQPPGGHHQFVAAALTRLGDAMRGDATG